MRFHSSAAHGLSFTPPPRLIPNPLVNPLRRPDSSVVERMLDNRLVVVFGTSNAQPNESHQGNIWLDTHEVLGSIPSSDISAITPQQCVVVFLPPQQCGVVFVALRPAVTRERFASAAMRVVSRSLPPRSSRGTNVLHQNASRNKCTAISRRPPMKRPRQLLAFSSVGATLGQRASAHECAAPSGPSAERRSHRRSHTLKIAHTTAQPHPRLQSPPPPSREVCDLPGPVAQSRRSEGWAAPADGC